MWHTHTLNTLNSPCMQNMFRRHGHYRDARLALLTTTGHLITRDLCVNGCVCFNVCVTPLRINSGMLFGGGVHIHTHKPDHSLHVSHGGSGKYR